MSIEASLDVHLRRQKYLFEAVLLLPATL